MARVRLGEVATERRETHKGSKSGYPVVGLEHLIPENVNLSMWDESGVNTFTKMFHKGDVLFGRRRAYLKKAVIAPFDGICSGDITVIVARPENILPELLPFVIQNEAFFDYAVGKSAGSLSPRVKWEYLREYEFELPAMDEQRKLARVLWAVNDTIEAYKRLMSATEDLVRGQFAEMYDNGQYPYMMLSDLSEQWLKGQPFKKDDMTEDGKIPCIHYGELFTKYSPIIENVLSRTNRNMIRASKKGDILFPASDVTTTGLTRCSALMSDDVLLGGDIIILRLKSGFCPEYVSEAICCQRRQLLSRITGSLIRHLSANALKTVKIPIPPYDLQQQFADFVHQADKSKFSLQKALTAARNISRKIISENLN